MSDILFSPIRINSISIKNRFVRSATQDYYANDDGSVSKENIELYSKFKDIGIIMTGYIYIAENGKSTSRQLGLYNDSLIDSFKALTHTVHKNNQLIFAQLVHGGRQVRKKHIKGEIWAPDKVLTPDKKFYAKKMSEGDILYIIDSFVKAIIRAKRADFDGIQLHAAHGYLLSQFLSPHINKRNDKWGGNTINRSRIIIEILKKARKKVGNNYPIIIKLNGDDGGIKNGLTIEESKKIARLLEENGIDAIEVSRGTMDSPLPAIESNILKEKDEAYLLPLAAKIKKEVNIPVISVGGYRSKKIMEYAIKTKKCDMISLSRPFIREPDLIYKFKTGKEKADCISCNRCHSPRGIKCYFV